MKTSCFILLLSLSGIAFGQTELTPAPADQVQSFNFLKLDGKFDFLLHGNAYTLEVDREQGTFAILQADGSINSSGTFVQHSDVVYSFYNPAPEQASLINGDVAAELSDRGTDRLFFTVTRDGERSIEIELIKSE